MTAPQASEASQSSQIGRLYLPALHARTGEPSAAPRDVVLSAGEPQALTQRAAEKEGIGDAREALDDLKQEYNLCAARYQEARSAGMDGLRGRDPAGFQKLKDKVARLEKELRGRTLRGVKEGVPAENIEQAGWGVVLPCEEGGLAPKAEAILEQLEPLLSWRKEQAGARFVILKGAQGYRAGESKLQFLARVKTATAGAVDPDKLPYYLLLIGSPEEIPFWFQSHLDVQYGVGRLYFDSLADYRRYAESVVRVEKHGNPRPPRFAVFAPKHVGDEATALSCKRLAEPLIKLLKKDLPDLEIKAALRDEATRDKLLGWLGGEGTPALLLTATHGLQFDAGDPLQRERQGALVCADWPGRLGWGKKELPESFYLSGDLLPEDRDLSGTILFCFSCYTGGTPALDAYGRHSDGTAAQLAPAPFIGGIPRHLLGRLSRGALAVVAHVERAWSLSFLPPTDGATEQPPILSADFQSTLKRLLSGAPVGWAMEYFNQRYAEVSTSLSQIFDEQAAGPLRTLLPAKPPANLLELWTAHNDARDYIVFGDPFVRLAPFTKGPPQKSALPAELVGSLSQEVWQATPKEAQELLQKLIRAAQVTPKGRD